MNVDSFLGHIIANSHVDKFGQKKLYFGQESFGSFLVGWVLPHDAPYSKQVNRYLMRSVEVGHLSDHCGFFRL